MSTLLTDDFNRANGGVGAAYTTIPAGGFWTGATVNTNVCDLTPDPSGSRRNDTVLPNDQWAGCTLANIFAVGGGNDGPGVAIRINTSNGAMYFVACATDKTQVWYVDSGGGFTSKATGSGWSASDQVYHEVQGTAAVVRKGGSPGSGGTSMATYTASELSSGGGGVAGSGAGGTSRIDNFTLGDFGGGAAGLTVPLSVSVRQAVSRASHF